MGLSINGLPNAATQKTLNPRPQYRPLFTIIQCRAAKKGLSPVRMCRGGQPCLTSAWTSSAFWRIAAKDLGFRGQRRAYGFCKNSRGSLSARENAMQLLEQKRFREMLPKRWILNIGALMDMSYCERERPPCLLIYAGNFDCSYDASSCFCIFSHPEVDRIWLWVYFNKIPIYPIFYLLKGDYIPILRSARQCGRSTTTTLRRCKRNMGGFTS